MTNILESVPCYWCNIPILFGNEVQELPFGRGLVHKKCAEEFFSIKMAENEKYKINPKLKAKLSAKEKEFLTIFENHCLQVRRKWAITWHISAKTKIPTSKINYYLSKLATKGILKKETDKHFTKFYYID